MPVLERVEAQAGGPSALGRGHLLQAIESFRRHSTDEAQGRMQVLRRHALRLETRDQGRDALHQRGFLFRRRPQREEQAQRRGPTRHRDPGAASPAAARAGD